MTDKRTDEVREGKSRLYTLLPHENYTYFNLLFQSRTRENDKVNKIKPFNIAMNSTLSVGSVPSIVGTLSPEWSDRRATGRSADRCGSLVSRVEAGRKHLLFLPGAHALAQLSLAHIP